jgi:riboflavin synthase
MFTGLVECMGLLRERCDNSNGLRLSIESLHPLPDLNVGGSISVNGACLTVVVRSEKTFSVDVMGVTREKSNLGQLGVGQALNLERPLLPGARLDGHWVLGHVDGMTELLEVQDRGDQRLLSLRLPEWLSLGLVPQGSVALDGVSLTVAGLHGGSFTVALVAHTCLETTLGKKQAGDKINVEADYLGKYVVNFMRLHVHEYKPV